MITCPECGQQADDNARFCDRCGQGLSNATSPAPAAIEPLAPGVELKGAFKIIEALTRTSRENRYRAERIRDGVTIQLREQLSSEPVIDEDEPQALSKEAEAASAAADPAGPTAKTAELRLKPAAPTVNVETGPEKFVAAEPFATENAKAPSPAAATVETPEESAEAPPAALPDKGDPQKAPEESFENGAVMLPEAAAEPAQSAAENGDANHTESSVSEAAERVAEPADNAAEALSKPARQDDLGEVFGRVLGLSLTLNYPAFQRAIEGFRNDGRVYLVYPNEELTPLSRRRGGLAMSEGEALNLAIQLCQA
ncbi:MAG TPA: zinc ribbon domain-containing protein, partial [Candidatus Binataceae bacterium]|nr:zinc ribbon domain-containing protein [Candidatus Binataceae bacterium]